MPNAADPAPRRPLAPGDRAGLAVAIVAFTAVVLGDLIASDEMTAWSVPFILVVWGPLLVLHELGHALAARWVGWTVDEVSIGFGKVLARFRARRTRVVIRWIPLEGFVVPRPARGRWVRAKNAFVYGAGPLAELIVLAAVVGVVGSEELLTRSDALDRIALQSLATAVLLGLFFNLVPHVTPDGRTSDGLGLLQSLFMTRDDVEMLVTRPICRDAQRHIERNDGEEALRHLDAQLEDAPSSVPLRVMRARALAATGDGEAADDALDALQRHLPRTSPEQMAIWLARAEVALTAPAAARLRDAELSLDKALELTPHDAGLHVTRGAVLVERGRLDEGFELLQLAHRAVRFTRHEPLCLAYLAIAAHRVGDASLADAYFRSLRECDPTPRVLSRVKDEIG